MNDLYSLLLGWVSVLLRPVVLLQIALGIGTILLFSFTLRPWLLIRHPRYLPLVDLSLVALLWLLSVPLRLQGLPVGVSLLIAKAFLVWVVLDLLRKILLLRFSARSVERMFARVIRPFYVVILTTEVILILTPLQDLSEVSLFSFLGQDFTLDMALLCLLFPYFLLVASEYPVAFVSRLLKRLLFLSDSGTRALELVLRYLVIGIGLVWLLNRIGLNSNAVAAIAGGLSIGVGFGVKELISNFISGLWLLFEGSVRPGDILFLDGDPCEVRSLGLRAARLWRQRDNAELLVPNQEFFTTTTTTYTGTDHMRRGEVAVSAAYRHDPDVILPLLLEAAASVSLILPSPAPRSFLVAYGESSIDYILRYWIADPMDNLTARSQVSRVIWHIFADHGIEIPFPQRVLHHSPEPSQPPR
jgi:small-conductance mechanosensitive channel